MRERRERRRRRFLRSLPLLFGPLLKFQENNRSQIIKEMNSNQWQQPRPRAQQTAEQKTVEQKIAQPDRTMLLPKLLKAAAAAAKRKTCVKKKRCHSHHWSMSINWPLIQARERCTTTIEEQDNHNGSHLLHRLVLWSTCMSIHSIDVVVGRGEDEKDGGRGERGGKDDAE